MTEILYAPTREQTVTTNTWAFLHWLRTARGVDLPDWAALQRFSAERAADFRSAVQAFARLPGEPLTLARHAGAREALVLLYRGTRIPLGLDDIRTLGGNVDGLVKPGHDGNTRRLTLEIAQLLTRIWSPSQLVRPLADVLLHADVRPDDRLLVSGAAWPWLVGLPEGTTVALTDGADLIAATARERATVLVAPAQALAEAAFQRHRSRPDLAGLRAIVATGGPLSPEGRRRIYTWIKPDLMLLARTGDTLWGNPLEPVLARPRATPALLTPPSSDPARR
jgi:hypothetical protein